VSKIRINDTDYDADQLPEAAKQQLQMLMVTDAEIKRLQAQLAIAQTAKNAYMKALAETVQQPVLPVGDTIKLG
jgi:hypothetical protein